MYTKKEIGHYTWLCTLNKDKVTTKTQRNLAYSEITMEAMERLLLHQQQTIVVNEKQTGGFVIGSIAYARKAFDKLREFNPNKEIVIGNQVTGKTYRKIGFSIREQPINGFVLK